MNDQNDTPETDDTPLRFTLKRKEKPVIVTDSEGNDKEYVMRVMDGTQRDAWQDDFGSRLQPAGKDEKGDQTFRITKWSGMYAGLIKRTLFDPKAKKYVEPVTINSWPAEVVKDLYEACRKFNGLDTEGEETAKNASLESD
jgi:hypothetical protein